MTKSEKLITLIECEEEIKALELQKMKLYTMAFKAFPNSPRQLKIRKQIQELEKKIEELKNGK